MGYIVTRRKDRYACVIYLGRGRERVGSGNRGMDVRALPLPPNAASLQLTDPLLHLDAASSAPPSMTLHRLQSNELVVGQFVSLEVRQAGPDGDWRTEGKSTRETWARRG